MAGCDTKGLKDRCEYCKRGDYNFCTNYGTASPYGDIVTGAGWSDSFIYPAKGLAKVYDEITDEQAVMVEPTAYPYIPCCVPGPKRAKRFWSWAAAQ